MGGHGIPLGRGLALWPPTVGGHDGNTGCKDVLIFSYGRPQVGGHRIPAKIHFLMFFYGGPHGGPRNTARAAGFDLNCLFSKT